MATEVALPPRDMDAQPHPRLTLSHLLHPQSWDLPEWNGPHVNDPLRIIDKVDDLDSSLALLQRYRNSLRPIHRLSPDILALVFVDLAKEYDRPIDSGFGSCQWIYLAHVCHRWRSIALVCSVLWTRISTRYPAAALTCISRSGDAPLSFVVHPEANPDNSSQVLNEILSHIGRIRKIYIPCTLMNTENGGVHQMLSPIIEAPAPILDTLFVYRVHSESNCVALPTMFSSSTPCLTTLKLIYSYPALGRVSFASLKELYIRGKKRDLITMEISQLLQMLEACPRLEVLVTYKTTFVPSEGEYEFRQIRLDSLRWIDIARCSATVVTDMISRLIVPNCTLRLSVWLERRDDFRFLFGVPYDLEETHPLRDIRRLHITYQSASGAIVLEGNTSMNPFQITATIGSGSNIGDMPTVSGPLLQSVTKTLDLSLLEEFAVAETAFYQPHTGFSRDTWLHVLEKMPMLKVLHVRLQSITDGGFCRALLSALSTPEEVTGRLPCPHLETLTLTDDKTWSSLQCYKFAEERSRRGQRLKRLSLRLPHYENVEDMADTDLTLLREVVEVVDTDPQELKTSEFPDTVW